jgi:cytochrome c oxidase assembly protein subunit 11
MSPRTSKSELSPKARRNRNVVLLCLATFFGMIGAAYASIPLYKAFCQATGFDGTVTRAKAAPKTISAQSVTVRFDANVNNLPWDFTAEQTAQKVQLGETKLAFFKVVNNSDRPVTARAVFNVVPEQAGSYFKKLQCFCFSDQTIAARQTVEMPVLYFVDPKYAEDFETKSKTEITLSYTFYPATDAPPAGPKS